MQYKEISGNFVSRAGFTLAVKTITFCVTLAGLLYLLSVKDADSVEFFRTMVLYVKTYPGILSFVVVLSALNWLLETRKWHYLVNKFTEFSFLTALKGIITGITLGLITPHGIGDYAGRIFQLSKGNRSRYLGAILLTRVMQLYMTLIFGTAGILYFIVSTYETDRFLNSILVSFLSISLFFSVLFLLFYRQVIGGIRYIPLINRLYLYLEIIRRYENRDLWLVFLWSGLRYFVFTGQFILLLLVFDVSADILTIVMGACFVFLVKSIIPTLFDLGVREYSAVYFFSFFGATEFQVLNASLLLWVINLFIPAISGLFLIFNMKIFSRS